MMRTILGTLLLIGLVAAGWSCTKAGREDRDDVAQTPGVSDDAAVEDRGEAQVPYRSVNLMTGDSSFELSLRSLRLRQCDEPAATTQRADGALPALRAVTGLAVHGTQAARIELPARVGPFAVAVPAVRLGRGTFTISVYARAKDESPRLRWRLHGARTIVAHEPFPVGPEWWRYAFTFEVSERGLRQTSVWRPELLVDRFHPEGAALGATWLDLDAVQLEPGPSATPYRPAEAITLSVDARRRPVRDLGTWVDALRPGDPLVVAARLRNNTRRRLRVHMGFDMAGEESAVQRSSSEPVYLDPAETGVARRTFGAAPIGWQTVRCVARVDDHVVSRAVEHVAVLPRAWREDVPALRFVGLSRPAEQAWPAATAMPAQTEASHVRFLCRMVLDLGKRGSADPDVLSRRLHKHAADVNGRGGEPVVHVVSASPGAVARLVEAAGETVAHWLVDALDAEDVERVRALRENVRTSGPDARLHALVPVLGEDHDGREPCGFLREGGAAVADGLVVRCDPTPPSKASWPESLDRALAGVVRSCIQADAAQVTRWVMTTRWPWGHDAEPSDRAATIHRAALILRKHGVERWLVPPPGPSSTGSARAACPIEVASLRGVEWHLGGASFRHARTLRDGVHCLVFDSLGKPLAGVWTKQHTNSDPAPVVVLPATVDAYDLFGRRLGVGRGTQPITLGLAPIYLRPHGEDATWLDALRFEDVGEGGTVDGNRLPIEQHSFAVRRIRVSHR